MRVARRAPGEMTREPDATLDLESAGARRAADAATIKIKVEAGDDQNAKKSNSWSLTVHTTQITD